MSKILGKARISIGGKLFDTMKGASLDPGGDVAATKTSAHKVAGYTDEMRPSRLECKIPATADVSQSELQAIRDASATYEGDNGKIWTIPKAWTVDTVKVDDQSGELTLALEGEPAEEHG